MRSKQWPALSRSSRQWGEVGARTAAGREGRKTGEMMPGDSLRDYHGVNNPPLARVWSNHRLSETDNGAQMVAATPATAK